MSSRPVAPVDPAGRYTDRVGPHGGGGNVGPRGDQAPIQLAVPRAEVQVHVDPYSDVMNWPAAVQEMLMPSASATGMAAARWVTGFNMIADAEGLGTPYDTRQAAYVPILNMATITGNYQRAPNLYTGVPHGTKMSLVASRFNAFLRTVQGHLIGSP